MTISDLITDGPVVAMMTNAGNTGMAIPMLTFAFIVCWALCRMRWGLRDVLILIGDLMAFIGLGLYRYFWMFGITYAENRSIDCFECARLIKENSYAAFAWDWRGVVTLLASAAITYGAAMRAAGLIDVMRNPYRKATLMLVASWVAGATTTTYGMTWVFIVQACCIAIIAYRFERSLKRHGIGGAA